MSDVKWLGALNGGDKMDFRFNENPICPHCAFVCDVQSMEDGAVYEEGCSEVYCPSCGNEFTISTHVSWKFSTDKQV